MCRINDIFSLGIKINWNKLATSKTLYVDGTFNVVKKPFYQLFSFHAFIQDGSNEVAKQIPLLFVIMSGKSKKDYIAVMKCMLKLVPSMSPWAFVLDFEKAIWEPLRKFFQMQRNADVVFIYRIPYKDVSALLALKMHTKTTLGRTCSVES